mgnify:CR=1 FL=1
MIGCAGAKPANRIHRLSQEAIDKDQRLRAIQRETQWWTGGGIPVIVQKIEMNVHEAIDNAYEGHTGFVIEEMMDCPLFVGDWVIWIEEYHDPDLIDPVRHDVFSSRIELVEIRGVA